MEVVGANRVGTATPRRPVLRDVIEEHLEQVAYLAVQRRKMLFSPDVGLAGLADLDGRIVAHRDGVHIAGPVGVEIAEVRLGDPDPWQHYVAARTWLEAGRPSPHQLLARLNAASGLEVLGWREALRRLPGRQLESVFPIDPALSLPKVSALAVDVWGWHARLPVETARSLAESPLGPVRAAVARATACDIRLDAGLVETLSEDPDRDVVRRAIWSAVLRAPGEAAGACRRFLGKYPEDPFVVQTLGLVGDLKDVDRVVPLITVEPVRAAAIRALGHLGNVSAAEPLLGLLEAESSDVTLAASDALESILGSLPAAARSAETGSEVGGPVPLDAGRARQFWSRRAPELDPAGRWVRGRSFPVAIDPSVDSMWSLWRLAVGGVEVGPPGLRFEVPDGFFAAAPTLEALVGE